MVVRQVQLGNFASLDPKLRACGIKGLPNISKVDAEVWREYMENWDDEFFEGEKLLAQKKHSTIVELNQVDLEDLPIVEGKEKERLVKVRVNQYLFRKIVLSNFNYQCCFTGMKIPELLVASHILPWSKDHKNQLNPKNGLALNVLHDKAFDKYLITVTEDLKIKVSSTFYKHQDIQTIKENFINIDGKTIIAPTKFDPDIEFLKHHNDRFVA